MLSISVLLLTECGDEYLPEEGTVSWTMEEMYSGIKTGKVEDMMDDGSRPKAFVWFRRTTNVR